ncbi:beta-galactosidase [Saccharothrix ecbatanensis]|uniref:Beta-galactosidase n=1 Tax=Saccharothrix ecbatanensis TaxID=1105145 RepID=A0A7W9M186_9PSEU|nr:beta-galactosidase [Saccharothrix ecbatanensis]MBB5803562.1 beta-galactosidase [Saccharothrix ecbatanensis]
MQDRAPESGDGTSEAHVGAGHPLPRPEDLPLGSAERGRSTSGLFFGGDYNPDQWPEEVWAEDFALMRTASVNLATVGVFSWSRLQPSPDRFDFDWLDRVLDGLHSAGVGVCLATPTASPPLWFTRTHPDALPVTRQGVRLVHGSRDTYCINAPAYRQASLRIATELANRYSDHPALRLWHVHNEYGTWCFCEHCEHAFQDWLRDRHGTLDSLNDAWSTDFWSQRYGRWDEVLPPRATQYLPNPAQELDYRRFLSDSMIRHYRDQQAVLAGRWPVTTNFVVDDWVPVDHAAFAREVDLVAIDHYPTTIGEAPAERAFAADRARGWARAAGHPDGRWLLMEHAAGAIHTDGVLRSLPPGSITEAAETHLARGAVGIMYFQWRASRGGAEQWHPAMIPHEGSDGPVFDEITRLGAALATRAPEVVDADVALVYDEQTMWAWQGKHLPTRHVDYDRLALRWHAALTEAHGNVDVTPPGADLGRYRLVVVPALYLMSATTHNWLRSHTGDLVLTATCGLVDEHARVTPSSLQDIIGARVTARIWLPPTEPVVLADGRTAGLCFETLQPTTARVLHTTADGSPAVIRNGRVTYIAALDLVDPALTTPDARPVSASLGSDGTRSR